MRRLGCLLPLLLLALAAPVIAAPGWRTAPTVESDADWLARLDRRLVPIHGTIADTLALLNTVVMSDAEIDAYVTVLQEQAKRGIFVLDDMEPARLCAIDYAAVERTLFLLWGDAGDSWRAYRAGSGEAQAEVAAMIPAAAFLLGDYGQRVHDTSTCTPPPPKPTAAPPTPTPRSSPTAEAS